MENIILYKSIRHSLQVNIKAVIEAILEKIKTYQFFILYSNIKNYKNNHDQKIFNCNTLVSYFIKYICFIKP